TPMPHTCHQFLPYVTKSLRRQSRPNLRTRSNRGLIGASFQNKKKGPGARSRPPHGADPRVPAKIRGQSPEVSAVIHPPQSQESAVDLSTPNALLPRVLRS